MSGDSLAPPESPAALAPPESPAALAPPESPAAQRPQGPLDVRRFVDERPVSRYQLAVATICGAIVFLDGFDAQVMGYVAPRLSAELHIVNRAALGPVLSAGLVGMMVGALVFGPLADRLGRRPILLLCPLLFGVGSLLTATAASKTDLIVFRLITGFGMGGAMPNAIALTAEYMPKRSRATAVTTMFCGFSIGAAAVGWVAAAVIPRFGWQSVFVIGGILPCLITAVSFVFLPESIRFLVRKPANHDRAARYLSRIAPDAPVAGGLTITGEESRGGFVVTQLFAGGRHWLTLLLWAMFFANLLDLYFVNSWLPTIMKDAGIPETRSIQITTLFQVGGTVGAVVIGRLIDRNLSFRLLAMTYLGAAVCVFLIGESGISTVLLIITVFASGLGVIGAQNGANALSAEVYPTESRSTGVGWALGIGRIGSILGPTLGGMLVGTTPRLFLIAAIPLGLASLAAFVAAGQARHRST